MFIKSILAYIYLLISFITLVIIYIVKCTYNNNFFDKFLYLDEKNEINKYTYYASNSLLFFIYGIIFGIRNIYLIILKIIIYDSIIFFIKYCNHDNIDINSKEFQYSLIALFKTIMLSTLSYYVGTIISNQFYNVLFNLNNNFNIKITFNKKKK
jgi:hypothetical protein